MKKLVISGPESTGKTDLAIYLASHYNGEYISEYAREYISSLSRPYDYDDLVEIAMEQIRQFSKIEETKQGFVFLDTWLIITKVWFIEVYNRYPEWLDIKINTAKVDLYLLCFPDIPWVPDPIRENGGEKRIYLFHEYQKEIIKLGIPYRIIKGNDQTRYDTAINYINEYFKIL